MKGVDEAAREFVSLFERLGIRYAVMGGLAVRAHAIPRPTYDVDFTIELPREKLPALYRAAEQLGYAVPEHQATGWIDEVQGLPVVKVQWHSGPRSVDIDIFLAESPFQVQLLDRSRRDAEDLAAVVVSPEDLILLKLIAGRPKDRLDVADVLFIQGRLDEDYMRLWADRLGVAAELEAALAEAGG